MSEHDFDNTSLAQNIETVDILNAEFYGRFPYPWPPMRFVSFSDPDFTRRIVCQDIGDFRHQRMPRTPRIWIAGCGTNQATFTALRHPHSNVLGSDLSGRSLEICAKIAQQLGVQNLELRKESLNHVQYKAEFDYVISTGVIHHNANPIAVLRRLAEALRPGGILELMVYNRCTWSIPAIFQKAVRLLGDGGDTPNLEAELEIATKLVSNYPVENAISRYVQQFKNAPESKLADALLQPVLRAYTVESLGEIAAECGLEYLTQCVNLFDKGRTRLSWNLVFDDVSLQRRYDALPDQVRWQLSNVLEYDASHEFLWFYMQRRDSEWPRSSEAQLVEAFLDTRFTRSKVRQHSYIRNREGSYEASQKTTPYPFGRPAPWCRALMDNADGTTPMRKLFTRIGLSTDFHTANEARLRLTTSIYPFLISTDVATARLGNHLG